MHARLARPIAAIAASLLLSAGALGWTGPHAAPQDTPRVVAIGDVHGALGAFTDILRRAGLIDQANGWTGGRAVLVQTGDFTDRGPDVRGVMDLLMSLEPQAARAGGRVQVLLGNHEIMNLLGDTRDASAEAMAPFADRGSEARRERAFAAFRKLADGRAAALGGRLAVFEVPPKAAWMAAHPPGYLEYREAFEPRGRYGRWLRSKAVVAKIGDVIFLHAGINPDEPASLEDINRTAAQEIDAFHARRAVLVARGLILPFFTLDEVVAAVQAEIAAINAAADAARAGDRDAAARLQGVDRDYVSALNGVVTIGQSSLLRPEGPLWFRGLAQWPPERAPDVIAMLQRHEAARIVIGHTVSADHRIDMRFDGRVFVIDTGMLAAAYEGRASALEIRGNRTTAIYPDQTVVLTQ